MWTRRGFLGAVGAVGLTGGASRWERPAGAEPASWWWGPPVVSSPAETAFAQGLTATDVVERIRARVGIPWMTQTVDRIVAGRPDAPVRGIATTMMATLAVLQRAARDGRNLVITHEPTFYSHQDTTDVLAADPTYQAKQQFIATHDLVVFHFHDHWHRMQPDGIATGMARALDWQAHAESTTPPRFALPETRLDRVVAHMKARLDVRSIRVVGKPDLRVRRVVASWGYASLMPRLIEVAASPDVDVIIVGETREWELVEYVQDQIAAGLPKGLIVINHVVSEQAGMAYCAEWLRPIVPEVPVTFIAADEPFW
jgi:putative NIF3 family GTP cyclohydrolase 1 type 2